MRNSRSIASRAIFALSVSLVSLLNSPAHARSSHAHLRMAMPAPMPSPSPDAMPAVTALLPQVRALLADAGSLQSMPDVEVGALVALLPSVTKAADRGISSAKPLARKIIERIAQLSLYEVLNGLQSETPAREPFDEALNAAWAERARMPTGFARSIFEAILNLAPRSRAAMIRAQKFDSYDDNLGITRAEYFKKFRRAEREFIQARAQWDLSDDLDISDLNMIDDVASSIRCPREKSVTGADGADEKTEEETEEDADLEWPLLWKGDDADHLIDELSARVSALEFSADSTKDPSEAQHLLNSWQSTMDDLANIATACHRTEAREQMRQKMRDLDAIVQAINDGQGRTLEAIEPASLTPPEDTERDRLYDEVRAGLLAVGGIQATTPDLIAACWNLVAQIGDPLVRVEWIQLRLETESLDASQLTWVLQLLENTGRELKTTSREGYLFHLWKMLENPTLAKRKLAASVTNTVAPELLYALNHLPNSWRTYFLFPATDGNSTEDTQFGQQQVRGQASFYARDLMRTEDFAVTWKRWRDRDAKTADAAFAAILDPSLRWALRFEWLRADLMAAALLPPPSTTGSTTGSPPGSPTPNAAGRNLPAAPVIYEDYERP